MKVAITGGSGQLGTLILRRLIDDRGVKAIVALDVRPPMLVSGKLKSITADVRDADIGAHLAGCDALVHLAFIVTGHAPRAIVDAVNVGGSKNVFRAAVAAGVQTIVYSSSIAAYGVVPGHPVPLVEDSPRRYLPSFAYSATKFEVEAFLDEFEAQHPEVAIARLRPAILVGARMEHALGNALRRRLIPSSSAPGTPMPLVWDEDVADAALLCLKQRARGAFNLAADDPLPPTELAARTGLRVVKLPRLLVLGVTRVTARLAERGLMKGADPAWLENGDAVMVASSRRARDVLGWKPRCNTAVDVIRRFDEVVPERVDSRIAMFFRAVDLGGRFGPAVESLGGLTADVHLQLTGRGGGDYAIRVGDRRVRVHPGIPRPPSSTLTMPAAMLLDLLAGQGSDLLMAQMTGRIRVDGQPVATMILGGMVSTFRARTLRAHGPRGAVARAFGNWIAGGASVEKSGTTEKGASR